MKYVEVKAAKEYANTVMADPILKAAVNSILDNAPGADIAPVVHGRWRRYTRWSCGIKKDDGFTASCCGRWNNVKTAYCPNCGAKMDGGADNAAD